MFPRCLSIIFRKNIVKHLVQVIYFRTSFLLYFGISSRIPICLLLSFLILGLMFCRNLVLYVLKAFYTFSSFCRNFPSEMDFGDFCWVLWHLWLGCVLDFYIHGCTRAPCLCIFWRLFHFFFWWCTGFILCCAESMAFVNPIPLGGEGVK